MSVFLISASLIIFETKYEKRQSHYIWDTSLIISEMSLIIFETVSCLKYNETVGAKKGVCLKDNETENQR